MSHDENEAQHTEMPLAVLLARLSPVGKEAVVLALGEGWRIGRRWLGVEFLLMGLSKQRGQGLPALLAELGVKGGHLRGAWRGMAGVVVGKEWKRRDVRAVGSTVFARLDAQAAREGQAEEHGGNDNKAQVRVTARMRQVWQRASELASPSTRSGCHTAQVGHEALLVALLEEKECLPVQRLFREAQKAGWGVEKVDEWVEGRLEKVGEAKAVIDAKPVEMQEPKGTEWLPLTGWLAKVGRDLTAEARAGKLKRPIGVDGLLWRVKRVLIQPEVNNVLLVGPPGVGKTALVEGLAHDLADGKAGVAELEGRRVVELRINELVAGSKYRGELEERVTNLLADVKADPSLLIFIDELHLIMGGGQDSSRNIAQWLKPALARGEFPCIGATTLAEYRQLIEPDGALTRRFQRIDIAEPTVAQTIKILSQRYSDHIAPNTIAAAVKLTTRYLPHEQQPAKTIRLLENAHAYIKLPSLGAGGEVLFSVIDEALLRYLLEQQTRIPLTDVAGDEISRIKQMDAYLKEQVIGQQKAVDAVAHVVKRARAGLNDPTQPIGVLLFTGPTGVGKTELARALADFLFGERDTLIRLDMSEYTEKHQVARLIGAPPGYIGHQEEGQLTGKLRQHPHRIVLLDEIEKAHPDVHHLFLQLFDDGRLTDSKGRTVSGRDAIFIMTSNLGSDAYQEGALAFGKPSHGSPEWLASKQQSVEQAIKRHFKPEFLNRIDHIVHFTPLNEQHILQICELQLNIMQQRLIKQHNLHLTLTPAAKKQLAKVGYHPEQGARHLKRTINDLILKLLTDLLFDGKVKNGDCVAVDYNGVQFGIGAEAHIYCASRPLGGIVTHTLNLI